MGRYFRYRIHPFSYSELLSDKRANSLIQAPKDLSEKQYRALLKYGGFPEPLFKEDDAFYANWSQLRLQQLFNEDVRDLTRIQEVKQMELLATFLKKQVGSLVNLTSLGKKVRVSSETVRRWLNTLALLYYSFPVQPWSKNISLAISLIPFQRKRNLLV